MNLEKTPEKSPEQVESQNYQYKILNRNYYDSHLGGHGVEAKWRSDEEMRAEYVGLTFELIEEAVEGNYDTILFLDKSGRPVSWLVNELWSTLTDTKKPEMKYINIDANRLLGHADDAPRPSAEEVAGYAPSAQDIEELREIYGVKNSASDATYLDDKNILVVDEVKVSGATANISEKLLRTAFPTTKFTQYHWLSGATETKMTRDESGLSQITQVTKLPVWYHSYDPRGRGVGDVEPGQSRFLSSPNIRHEKIATTGAQEELSLDLRTDITRLAADVRYGRQGVQPRGDDKYYYFVHSDGAIDYDKPRFKLIPVDQEAYGHYIEQQKSRQTKAG